MRNKRFFRSFFVLLAALVVLGVFSVTAYAYSGEEANSETTVQAEAEATAPGAAETQELEASEAQEPEKETTGGVEPQPFTPEGNMTLVDEIQGEASENKEFIVVQSKGGNYFYIVIDHAAQGENTVHFLNQVDEADLMAIIEDENGQTQEAPDVCSCADKCEAGSVNLNCPVCSTNMSECAGKEAADTPDEPEQTEESGGIGGIILFAVVALLGGGGALYYFKIMKPKQAAEGGTDLEDFDFDEYEDEQQNEDEQPEADDEQEDEE